MSDCCSPNFKSNPIKKPCPNCGYISAGVSTRTIVHQIKHSWLWNDKNQSFYFCEDPNCDVAYFGEDNSVIVKSQLRSKIGVKDCTVNAPLCYCFGITQSEAINAPSIRNFVLTKTSQGICSCETSNPSGRCCLKDFPR